MLVYGSYSEEMRIVVKGEGSVADWCCLHWCSNVAAMGIKPGVVATRHLRLPSLAGRLAWLGNIISCLQSLLWGMCSLYCKAKTYGFLFSRVGGPTPFGKRYYRGATPGSHRILGNNVRLYHANSTGYGLVVTGLIPSHPGSGHELFQIIILFHF